MKNSTKTYKIKNIHLTLSIIYDLIALIITQFIIINHVTTIDDLLIELFSIITLLGISIPLIKHTKKGFQNINTIYTYNKSSIITLLLNLLMLLTSFIILNTILSLIITSTILFAMYDKISVPFTIPNNIFIPIAILVGICFATIMLLITKKILKRYYKIIDGDIQHFNATNETDDKNLLN